MKLIDYCKRITGLQQSQKGNDKIGRRIMRPEYSLDQVEVKTFPRSYPEGIFILCWRLGQGGRLSATIKPYEVPFSYQDNFTPGARTQFHTHDYIELAYVVEGEFMQKIMGQDIQFKKGEICLIDKNCLHQDYLFDNNSTILFIGLANEIFDEVMVDKIEEESILHFLRMALLKQKDVQQFLHFKPKNMEDPQLEELLLSLLLELEQQDEASKYICKGLLMRILHYISSKYDFSLTNEQRKKMNWIAYMEITNYIQEHYVDITIKELVKKFHFNEDYYNRLLKDKTGMTYSEYVQNIRLTQADKLLRNSKLTIEEIANQVGYHNKGYFYKIFTERFGATPSKYRKQLLSYALPAKRQ